MAKSAAFQEEQQKLLDIRNKAVAECRRIVDEAKGNPLTAEQEAAFAKWEKEAREAKAQLDKNQRDQERLDWLAEQEKNLDEPLGGRRTPPEDHAGDDANTDRRAVKEIAWNSLGDVSPQFRAKHTARKIVTRGDRASAKYNEAFNRYLLTGNASAFTKAGFSEKAFRPSESMDMNASMRADEEERGGYFVASEEFLGELLKNVDDLTFVQRLSRVLTVRNARSLGVRKRTSKFRAWTWGSELADVSTALDSSLKYGKRALTPHYMMGAFRISRDLLRTAAMPVEQMVIEEAGIDLAETLEDAYLYGNGVQKPLGVMVPSSNGISAARDTVVIASDVASGESPTTHFGFNSLIRAKYMLKLRYRNRARWMFHRDTMSRISMIRDANGQYIWQPSKVVGDPDTILGLPADESEWMPNTFTTGLYYGILADWSYYWIAFGLELEIQRLEEMRARNNEYEYLMRLKVDAMPVLEEAFVRLKLG